MDLHKKKMIAPIVICILLVLYYILYFSFLMTLLNGVEKILFGIIPLVFSGVTIYVCVERINEIRKGEEDDLSKY